MRLMGLESNKAAHHIKVCEPSQAKVTYIAWASCHSSAQVSKGRQEILNGVAKEFGRHENDADLDLPQELTFVEADTALPKISPLPSASAGAGSDIAIEPRRDCMSLIY